jgi:hypothetical protein
MTDIQTPRIFHKPALSDCAKLPLPNVTAGAVCVAIRMTMQQHIDSRRPDRPRPC